MEYLLIITKKYGIGTDSPNEALSIIGSAGLYGTVSSGIISPASLTFYTSENNAGLGDSTDANKQKSGEIIWYGKDSSTNAAGEYASIESYIIDANNLIQGSANEGGQIEFNIWRHDASTQPRVKYTALTIDNTANATFASDVSITGNVSAENIGTAAASDVTDFVAVTGDTMTGALTILAPNDPKIILQTTSGDTSDWNYINFVGRDAVRDSYIGTDADGDMQIYSDKNSSRISLSYNGIILNGGDVGIGTTSPQAKLHVNGD
jgi:hypothetical protein